jgi:hypothetical protein
MGVDRFQRGIYKRCCRHAMRSYMQRNKDIEIVIDQWNKMSCSTTLNQNMSGFTCKQIQLPLKLVIETMDGIRAIDFNTAPFVPPVRTTARAWSNIMIDYEYLGNRVACSKAGRGELLCSSKPE